MVLPLRAAKGVEDGRLDYFFIQIFTEKPTMNYIKLINAFWHKRRDHPEFDPYVISLFFALVSKANNEGWKSFEIYREDITALAGMSPSVYYKARKTLKDAGFIDFQEGASKLSQCRFNIIQLYSENTEAYTEGSTEGDTEQTQKPIQKEVPSNKTIKPINLKPLNNLGAPPLKENNSEALKAEPEKPKEKSSAKKEKVQEHYFEQSPYYDRQFFLSSFTATSYPISEHPNTDTSYYYDQVKHWAEYGSGNNPGKQKKKDWLATARTFMKGDIEKGKLKRKTTSLQNGQSTYTNRQQQSNGVGADLEAAVAMSRFIVSDGYKQAG